MSTPNTKFPRILYVLLTLLDSYGHNDPHARPTTGLLQTLSFGLFSTRLVTMTLMFVQHGLQSPPPKSTLLPVSTMHLVGNMVPCVSDTSRRSRNFFVHLSSRGLLLLRFHNCLFVLFFCSISPHPNANLSARLDWELVGDYGAMSYFISMTFIYFIFTCFTSSSSKSQHVRPSRLGTRW